MQTWPPVFLEPSRNPDPTGLNGDFSAFAGFGEAMMGICDIILGYQLAMWLEICREEVLFKFPPKKSVKELE